MNASLNPSMLVIAARSSPLSKIQVQEVENALLIHFPNLSFQRLYMKTTGCRDQKTSLRSLDKTDFFTRELDQLVLRKGCHVCVHSAKDLPEPLPEGLKIYALTEGLDPSDALVFRENESLDSLSQKAKIATSSIRREEVVKTLRSDLTFIDVRGTIEERLALLDKGEADGVVIAEAALIRLGLNHLNRLTLPGETVEGQGRLAVVGRQDEPEIEALFAPLDARVHA